MKLLATLLYREDLFLQTQSDSQGVWLARLRGLWIRVQLAIRLSCRNYSTAGLVELSLQLQRVRLPMQLTGGRDAVVQVSNAQAAQIVELFVAACGGPPFSCLEQ